MASHNELGKLGESIARDFLISKGMIIREQNWRMNHLEIDLVAEDTDKALLHIVEVKTRSSDDHYDPMAAINHRKRTNLINAANGYVRYYQLKFGIQYDVITIIGSPENYKINYIPDAFRPSLRTYR
ncbi:MAG: YraN family protein [Muribaculaceae bacterium]|nr:YraN family protein [Muribaculaceae bacterium]